MYFICKNRKYRNGILIIASLIFYAWGEPVWICLLLTSVTLDYFNGLYIEKNRGTLKGKLRLIFSLVVNLSLLGFFKYANFVVENLNGLFSLNLSYSPYTLPIGISFYTFQTISYVVDVYRNQVAAQKFYFNYLLYVASFHQLVAGPIVRYKDIAHQIKNRIETQALFSEGINRFAIGLGKKVIIANTAGEISDFFLKADLSTVSVCGAWFGIMLYSLQIYFDFSGYSDMAIGLGRMFGFKYKENFNYPYISKSASEFWRRWHMSLGSFFRDYVYIPLGGNRTHNLRNMLIVWSLTGLWHGASWNFITWGMFYGLLILAEKSFWTRLLEKLPGFCAHIYLLVIMLVGWVFFYFLDLATAWQYIRIMFGFTNAGFIDSSFTIHFRNNIYFVLLSAFLCTPVLKNYWQQLLAGNKDNNMLKGLRAVFNGVLIIVSTTLLVGQTYNPFLYFRF